MEYVFPVIWSFLNDQKFILDEVARFAEPRSTLQTTMPRTRELRPLLDLLIDAWPRQASDARDKVYAFMSPQLTSTPYADFKPDYTLDMWSVFIRLIRVYINEEKDLNFLRYACGIDDPIDIVEHGFTRTIIPLDMEMNPKSDPHIGHWRFDENLDRVMLDSMDPSGIPTVRGYQRNPVYSLSGQRLFCPGRFVPSWVCDWRARGIQRKDDASLSRESTFATRTRIPPILQSLNDFSDRLVVKGIALGRVVRPKDKALGTFSQLPVCALQKADDRYGDVTGETSLESRRPTRFQDIMNNQNPPSSNMAILLLQTLLHDATECDCENRLVHETYTSRRDEDILRASCYGVIYPRSKACELDWVFLLDGMEEPILLRPIIIPRISSLKRSDIGFGVVSVCPLRPGDSWNEWFQARCAYVALVLF